MSELTIIIPNYNGMKYLGDCIQSLKEQTLKDLEIMVVDNGSEDESVNYLKENYPEVSLVCLDNNYGFSRAVNEGIAKSRSPFVLLLNNDTVSDPGMAEAFLKAIRQDERIFSVAGKLISMDDHSLLDGAGDFYCALGWAFARGKGKSSKRYDKPCDVFAACAAAAIYRKSILDEIGYFDEYHFAYLEDVDMGYRAKIMGYRNVYTPEAVVYHKGSASSGARYNDFKVRLSARNNIYLVFKNMPLLQLILNLPFLLIGFSVKALFFILKGYSRPYLSGIKRGYLLCHEGRHVAFDQRNLGNYVKIQIELWVGLFRRVLDFF